MKNDLPEDDRPRSADLFNLSGRPLLRALGLSPPAVFGSRESNREGGPPQTPLIGVA